MSKSVKFILTIMISLISLVTILSFIITSKIDLVEVKRITTKNLKSIYPNSIVQIGKVDHSIGTSIRIYLNNIDVQNITNSNVLNIKKLVIKFPVTALLINKGDINLQVEKLLFDVNLSKKTLGNSFSKEFQLPKFVKSNKVNLKIIDSKISTGNNIFDLQKVIIKDFNFKRSMAFEVVAKYEGIAPFLKMVSTDLQIIGEVNLEKYLSEDELSGKVILKNSKTDSEKLGNIKPLKTKLDFIFKDRLVFDRLEINHEKFSYISKGQFFNKFLELNDINLTIDSSIFKEPSVLELNNSKFLIVGKAFLDIEQNTFRPDLKIDFSKPFILNLEGIENYELNSSGIWRDDVFELKSTSNSEKVELSLESKLNIDLLEDKIFQYGIFKIDLKNLTTTSREFNKLKKNKVILPKLLKDFEVNFQGIGIVVDNLNFGFNLFNKVKNSTVQLFDFSFESGKQKLTSKIKDDLLQIQFSHLSSNTVSRLIFREFPFENSDMKGELSLNIVDRSLQSLKIKGLGGAHSLPFFDSIEQSKSLKSFNLVVEKKSQGFNFKKLILIGENKSKIELSGDLIEDTLSLIGIHSKASIKTAFKLNGNITSPKLSIETKKPNKEK